MAFDVRGNYTVGTHALVRLDKVASGENGNMESVVSTVDLEQGTVVALGLKATINGVKQREVHDAKVPATKADLTLLPFVLVAAPEINYNELGYTERDFYTKAGTVVRAYHLTEGDEFTIAKTLVDGVITEGAFVVPQAGSNKLLVDADATLTVGPDTFQPRLVLQVVKADEQLGGRLAGFQPSVVLKVISV